MERISYTLAKRIANAAGSKLLIIPLLLASYLMRSLLKAGEGFYLLLNLPF